MNALQINLSNYTSTGGTGIAMHRLQVGLKVGGHQSKIFCLVPLGVRPGITGLLAERKNVEEEDEALRLSMSTKCRAVAVEEYSLKLYTQRYIHLYHQVMEERAQSNDASSLKSNLYSNSR